MDGSTLESRQDVYFLFSTRKSTFRRYVTDYKKYLDVEVHMLTVADVGD